MTIFFTSDQHFGHANIIRHSWRPFADVVAMQARLIENHNDTVRPEDSVYHLGDFALDDRLVQKILPTLHGTHHLIAGNHDACHPCHRRHARAERVYRAAGFASVHERLTLVTGFGPFFLCHMPLRRADAADDARRPQYDRFRPTDEELDRLALPVLFHGHVHEKWRRNGRCVNVGVDVWDYRPVALERLVAYVNRTDASPYDPRVERVPDGAL